MNKDERDRILNLRRAKSNLPQVLRFLYGTSDLTCTAEESLDGDHPEPREMAVVKVGGGAYLQAVATLRPDAEHIESALGGTFYMSLN